MPWCSYSSGSCWLGIDLNRHDAARRSSRLRASAAPTFSADVAPIMYAKCVSCHRPGEVAPMSLITYKDVRPWASSIREKVTSRVMPPWHADRQYGTFRNEQSLTQAGDRHDREVGERERARRQSVAHAGAAEIPRGLADRHAGRRLRDADGVSRSRPRARSNTSTSRCRPTSPRTGGCRRAKCEPAIARTCITSSST